MCDGRSKVNRPVRIHHCAMARPRAVLDTEALADAFAAGASSAQLAAALGVGKATLYAHGVSKAALLRLALDAETERVLDRLAVAERASAGRSARERAAASVAALLEHA